MVLCQRCHEHIDSDFDVECFIDSGDTIACEHCRERMEREGELDVETNTTRSARKGAEARKAIEAAAEQEPT